MYACILSILRLRSFSAVAEARRQGRPCFDAKRPCDQTVELSLRSKEQLHDALRHM